MLNVKPRAFGYWTRTSGNTRIYRRGGGVRRALIFNGLVLILVSVGMILVNVRILGSSLDPVAPPKDETLRLTVPKMERVKNTPVYTAAANDNAKLDAGAIHVKDTGYPWEEEANVYIAGHRLGYPRTGSFLLFYDLDRLKNGDMVFLRDSENRRYVYQVFKQFVVDPGELSVMKPVPGKNVVSLQACTLPDYSRRLIVQAELVKVVESPAQARAR